MAEVPDPEAPPAADRHELIETAEGEEVRVRVEKRERDEIDMVVDAFWAFTDKVKRAHKSTLLLGLLLLGLGLGFLGWPSGWTDESRGGFWSLDEQLADYHLGAVNEEQLSFSLVSGDYRGYEEGDEFMVEGTIDSIIYYGPLKDEPYPEVGNYKGLHNDTLRPPHLAPRNGSLTLGTNLTLLHPSTGEHLEVPFVNGVTFRSYYFRDMEIQEGLFNEVRFENVIFENVTFNGTFFLSCNFDRVTFRNVTFRDSFFSHSRFEVVKMEQVDLSETYLLSSRLEKTIISDSHWNQTRIRNTLFHATRWGNVQFTGGYLRDSNIDVVVFRNLTTTNFPLIESNITNVVDVPTTGDLHYTFMTVRGLTLRIDGDLEREYPVGASIYARVMVTSDGNASTGTIVDPENGTREGWVMGDGLGMLSHQVLVTTPEEVHLTLWHSALFYLMMITGAWILVYTIGGAAVVLALVKFFTPFFLAAAGIVTIYIVMPTKQFVTILRWMFIYLVPPAGKESVIPLGITADHLNPWALAFSIAFVDIVLAIFLAWNFDLARRIPFVGGAIRRLQDKGMQILEEKPWVERLTFTGIVLFVIVPLQGSGALGGTVLGRSMGLGRTKIVGAVTIGALLGSFAIAASVYYGLELVEALDTYALLLTVLLYSIIVMILLTLWYIYKHWEEFTLDEFRDVLGIHQKSAIGAPLSAAGEFAGTAGASMARAVGTTGRVITRSTASIVDSIVSLGGILSEQETTAEEVGEDDTKEAGEEDAEGDGSRQEDNDEEGNAEEDEDVSDDDPYSSRP